MTENPKPPTRKLPAAFWLITGLLLYLLSAPPVLAILEKLRAWNGWVSVSLQSLYLPASLVYSNSAEGTPLRNYSRWWMGALPLPRQIIGLDPGTQEVHPRPAPANDPASSGRAFEASPTTHTPTSP